MPRISCLIPLYQSLPFYDVICENIDAHLSEEAEILLSDRHGRDDTTARLAQRYANEPRVRIMTHGDEADWISNINDLILASKGRYFRIVPHDDTVSAVSTMSMVRALDENEDAVLAYGIVRAIDLEGRPMPERDQLNEKELSARGDWTLEDALSLMWQNRFLGAFKGVVRADTIRAHNLLIRKTRTLILSERVWLFALSLMGRFQFVPESVLIKRYYSGSTSSTWTYTAPVFQDVVDLMLEYCDVLISDPVLREQAKLSVRENGSDVVRFRQSGGARPMYRPLKELIQAN